MVAAQRRMITNTCVFCDDRFPKKSSLQMHLITHKQSEHYVLFGKVVGQAQKISGPCSCDVCGKTYTTASHLKRHMLVHANKKPHQCDICLKQFNQNENLKRHLEKHAKDAAVEESKTCRVCDENLLNHNEFLHHLRNHTAEILQQNYKVNLKTKSGKRFNMCQICDKWLTVRSGLLRHFRTHSALVESHTCNVCQKIFTQKYNLIRHMQTHFKDQQTKSGEASDNNGQTSQIEGTAEKMFSCSECKKKFQFNWSLLRHLKTHAEAESAQSYCKVCENSFENKAELERHVRVHVSCRTKTKKRQFFCKQCGNAYSMKSNLFRHMRIHTDNRPYSCEVCGKSYFRKDALKAHMNSHPQSNISLA